jgi:hypothetical protein
MKRAFHLKRLAWSTGVSMMPSSNSVIRPFELPFEASSTDIVQDWRWWMRLDSKLACGVTHLEEVEKRPSRTLLGLTAELEVLLQLSLSSNMLEPFDDLDFWSSLIGSAGLIAFLFRHKIIHIPMREGNFILILFAEKLFLSKGGG